MGKIKNTVDIISIERVDDWLAITYSYFSIKQPLNYVTDFPLYDVESIIESIEIRMSQYNVINIEALKFDVIGLSAYEYLKLKYL